MTPQEILLNAALLIEECGWAQGNNAHFGMPKYCPITAIHVVVPRGNEAAVGLLRDYLREPSVVHWNDMPGRTQAEVVGAMRAAAGAV